MSIVKTILSYVSMVHAMLMKMDPTDPFESACFAVVGNSYEFGSKCDSDYYEETSRNGRCPCPDERFAETVVNCIDQSVANVSSDVQSETRNTSYKAFTNICRQYSIDTLYAYSANSSHLQSYDGNRSASRPGTWPVTRAFQPDAEEITNAYIVYEKEQTREDYNKRYGAGLVAYWAGVSSIRSLAHFSAQLFPMVVYDLLQNKLVRKIHGLGLRSHDACALSAVQVMIVGTFSVLTAVFAFIELGVWYPDNTALYRNSATYGNALGMRTGVLAVYVSPSFILFAGRNNFLSWLTGWSQDTFLVFHRWIARTEIALLIAHAIAYSVSRASRDRYGESWEQLYWKVGVVALSFGAFTVVQGMYWLRRRAYETFLVLHIIAVIMFLACGYWHLKALEEPIGLNFFYASFAVWAFDRAARLVRVVYAGFTTHETKTGLRNCFGTPALIELEQDTLVITFDRPPAWNIMTNPGQFVYIHFLMWPIFWQSHPFTLVTSTQDPNKLKIFVRIHKGITKKSADMTLKKGGVSKKPKNREVTSYQMETRVLLDGPYGHSHDLFEYDELSFVAGGTGITAPFSYIQGNICKFPHGFQKIKLFWAVTNPSLESWFEEELRFLSEFQHIEVHIFISRHSEKPRKLNVPEVLGAALEQIQGPTCVLTCGPAAMNADAKRTVANYVSKTPYFLQYYEESFSF